MKFKKLTIIIFALVIASLLIFLNIKSSKRIDPYDVIKDRLNLSLPTTSEIVNYKYSNRYESFHAKILINNSDVESVKNSLIAFFKREAIIHNEKQIPRCENTVDWWEMDKDRIELCYFKAAYGKQRLFRSSPKTIEMWAFLVKQNDENYFLYISI